MEEREAHSAIAVGTGNLGRCDCVLPVSTKGEEGTRLEEASGRTRLGEESVLGERRASPEGRDTFDRSSSTSMYEYFFGCAISGMYEVLRSTTIRSRIGRCE